ncbi:MAG: flagellin [Selenomonadaceae bacterium]|nr:flagellin [Selenomonadaceae bacterium]
MAMVVKNNLGAVRTLNTLNANSSALQKSLQKVSSGMKINSAQDDASGYAISERMRVRIRSLDQANQNTQNDSSLMKTAEGAVGNTVEILRALKEKAINAANDSNTDEDRQTIQKEINQFIDQIDDNALVQFNGKYLVDGSKNNATVSSRTILLNQSLDKATDVTSVLTTLNNRAGDSLNIATSDKYQVSWVQNGSIYSTTGNVGSKTLEDILTLTDKSNKQVGGVQKTDPTEAGRIQVLGDPGQITSSTSFTFTGSYTASAASGTPNSFTYAYYGSLDANHGNTPVLVTGTDTSILGASTGTVTVTNLSYGATVEPGKDKFDKAVYTPDKTEGLAVAASEKGVVGQLSGLTISILDQDGNVKKAANAALDQFKQYQRAENKTGDMSLNFHIGSEANVAIKVGMSDMRSQALGLKGSDGTRIDVFTKEHANAAINVIENALTKALDQQTTIGAIEARLEYTSTNLTTSSENVQAAESTIRDADMAKEMTNYTKNNVLLQAAQAMLAQANQNSSAVLSLLQ